MGLNDYPGLASIERKNFWWQAYPSEVDFDSPDMTRMPTMLYVGSETANGVRYEGSKTKLQGLTIFAPGNFYQAKDAYEQGTQALEELKAVKATLIIYSSPRLLLEVLEELTGVLGDRNAVIVREVTKLNEEVLRYLLLRLD